MRGRYRWGALAPLTALLVTLAGCSQVVNGSASTDAGSGSGSTSGSVQSPSEQVGAPATGPVASSTPALPSDTIVPSSAPNSVPTEPDAPTSAAPTDARTQSGAASTKGAAGTSGADFANVDFVTPDGFVKPAGYGVAVPLEDKYTAVFFAPKVAPQGLDVLSVFLYRLPSAGLADTSAQQLRRVEKYNSKVRAKVIGAITKSTLAGRPAFTEKVRQPPNYTYVTWFTFSSSHLLQMSCQYDKRALRSTIDRGCASLRSSLKLT